MPDHNVELGDLVRDRISGLEGVAVSVAEYLYNMDSIGVRPQDLRDGKPAETIFIDRFYLEIVKKHVIDSTPPQGTLIKLGDTVVDNVTSFKGIAIGKATWISGCIRIAVQSTDINKEKLPVEEQWFSVLQLERIKESKRKLTKPPGGPMKPPTSVRPPR